LSFLFSSRLCLATQFGLSGIVVARLTANLLEGLGFLSPLSSQTDYWLDVSALAAVGALLFTLPRCVFGGTGFRKSVARQGQILEQLHEAVIATDGDGIIVSWNSGAERLFGYTADEAIGQHASMLHARTKNEMEREIIAPLLRTGRLDMEGPMVRKSGDQFAGHMLASVLLGPDGGVAGMVGYILDITERKHAEQELKRNERLLAEAQRIAHLGNWNYDVAQNTIWWSDETYRLLGIEPDAVTPSLKSYLGLLPVEEQKNFKAALQDPIDHKRAYSLEHAIVLHDGTERVVHLRAEPVCDENG
jgi:PAS domain S-box-containing protein